MPVNHLHRGPSQRVSRTRSEPSSNGHSGVPRPAPPYALPDDQELRTEPAKRFRAFPLHALPEPVRTYVREASAAIGCDPSYVALPLFSALASAIGNSRRLRLKRQWYEPAIIWTAIVGDSGTAKSPALESALRHLRRRQHQAMMQFREELAMYEEAVYQRKAESRQAGSSPEPQRPLCRRLMTDDATVEAVAQLLQENPRGLLLSRDELSGWLNGFDKYSSGRGADAPKWLEVHGGRALLVDRKTSGTTYVARASVSVTGGIQPGALARALGTAHIEDGLAARLLFAMPPKLPRQWTEDDVSDQADRVLDAVFEQLLMLEPDREDGDEIPGTVDLAPPAKALFRSFVNDHGEQQSERTGAEAAAWSKLESYAGRLSLVIHMVRWAAGDAGNPDEIDEAAVRSAVAIVEWCGGEAERVYQVLSGNENAGRFDQIAQWVRVKRGGAADVSVIQRSMGRRYKGKTEELKSVLREMEAAGYGHLSYRDGVALHFRLADPSSPLSAPGGSQSAHLETETRETDALDDFREGLD